MLVTGDSDFTPVFRRLRGMDKDVIGVGRHSTLGECVKTSCTRFIYTNDVINHLKASPTPVNASQIKTLLKQHSSDFDEMHYGFKTFTDYLTANDAIEISKIGTVNFGSLAKTDQPTETVKVVATSEGYQALLKKYNAFPNNAETLKKIYNHPVSLKDICPDQSQFRVALFNLCTKADSKISKTTVNKVFAYFMAMGLVHSEKAKGGIDAVRVKNGIEGFFLKSDKSVIAKLQDLGKTQALDLKVKKIKKLTLSPISKENIQKLIGE